MNSKFKGTGVALATPFKEDLSVDYDGLKSLLAHTINNKVDYLVVNGTTGESATTTAEEKAEILDFVIKEANDRLPIMYGIGGNNTEEVVSKIQNFKTKGVDAILSVCPYYNKPSQEGIYHHYKEVAEASLLPIVLYNVPGRTGINISAKTTVRLSQVKNVIGIKEASTDLAQWLEILKGVPKDFLLISGDDMYTVPMISIGAQGVISVIANAFPKNFTEMINSALKGSFSEASEKLKTFSGINPLLYEEGNPVGVKECLSQLKICRNEVRLPLYKASPTLKEKIQQEIQKM